MQHFLKDCFTRRILPFFIISVVNYSQLCSFRPMHTQFRSILHGLKSFYYVKKQFYCLHRWWLVSSSSYRQDRIKKNKKGTFFKILTAKNFKIVCRKKVLLVSKCTELVFYIKIFSLFLQTDVFSLTSSRISWNNLYKKNSALFLVFCGELFPIVFI